ncbi:ChrR family anti-sigma-E factor [Neptunicella sp. SCSIO 80796]|uniref:ChrR family anti-sigma-E factor n=1 Tax=Neptunicella plasticusilytica TaxID=3117012 RepID=UPI003A4E4776
MAYYHPTDELLIRFSAGQMPDALGLMLACHLENCPQCRNRQNLFEQVGGELLQHNAELPVTEGLLDSILAKLDQPAAAPKIQTQNAVSSIIPTPLKRFVDGDYEHLPWSGFIRAIQEINLPFSDSRYTAKLYKIAAGKELPVHTHRGNEYTLVMQGSFSDNAGRYHIGDFIQTDTTTVHQPKAHDEGDCICFAVIDAPLKMTGFFGRMLNPFLR